MNEGLRFPFETAPAEGEALQVAEGILWLRLPLPMALDHVNVFALDDGDGWTLVDTGFYSKRSVALWECLLAGPMKGKPVRRVIVTHHHPDHIGMAGWFQTRGAELITTRTAWLYGRMLVLDVQTTPPAEQLLFLQRAGVDQAARQAAAVKRPFNFADVVAPLPLGFTRISEGDVLTAAGRCASATAMPQIMPRSGALMTASSWAEISSCPAFPPISASTPPSLTPTPWPNG